MEFSDKEYCVCFRMPKAVTSIFAEITNIVEIALSGAFFRKRIMRI